MKYLFKPYQLCLLFACSPLIAHAQVDISARLSQTTVIQHEPITANIRIRNNTAEPIRLTPENPASTVWLQVERSPGRLVRQTNPDLFEGEIIIPPMDSISQAIQITDSFDIRAVGPYTVRVRMAWRGQTLGAQTLFFDVVPGLELDQLPAVPTEGTGTRLYRLMTVNRNRRDELLFRVDDPNANICFAVIPLGSFLRVRPPQLRVDINHNAVILHQASPGRYFFHQFSPNGRLIRQQTYTSETPGVTLHRSEDGQYTVRGATASLTPR